MKRRRARNTLSIPRRRDDARIMVSLIPRRASGARTRYAYATEADVPRSNYRARSREPSAAGKHLRRYETCSAIKNWDVRGKRKIFSNSFVFLNPSLRTCYSCDSSATNKFSKRRRMVSMLVSSARCSVPV